MTYVRTLTDETGAVVDTRSYEAFGTKNSEAGSDPLPYGFAGEAFDSTTNLAYHRARWMDSRVGRFTGMDPHAPKRSNLYWYASGNPANHTDATGRDDMGGVEAGADGAGFGGLTAEVSLQAIAATARANQGIFQTQGSYLELAAKGRELINDLMLQGNNIPIVEIDIDYNRNENGQIFWNPHFAEDTGHFDPFFNRAGRVSPAIVLAHELVHFGGPLSDNEIITYWEAPISRQLAELGYRESPRNNVTDVPSPACPEQGVYVANPTMTDGPFDHP